MKNAFQTNNRNPIKSKFLLSLVLISLFLFHFLTFTKTSKVNVAVGNVLSTLKAFEEIADDHGGSRSIINGHKASMEYVIDKLSEMPSLDVVLQTVMIQVQVDEEAPKLTYRRDYDSLEVAFKPRLQVAIMKGSGSCRLSNAILIPYSICPGKENQFMIEHSDITPGWVALIYSSNTRECSPCDQLVNAVSQGAHGAIFITRPGNSEGYPHPLPPSPGRCGRIEKYRKVMEKIGVASLSDDAAFTLLNDIAGLKQLIVNLQIISAYRDYESHNIIATSKAGNSSKIIIFGSHLDSVPAGPGINDDGSGSAATLELARAFDASSLSTETVNQIKFTWWTGEEIGLLGSEYYVNELKKHSPDELKAHKINIDTDMIASPNYVRGVWDGSNIPNEETRGKAMKITNLIEDFFSARGLPVYKFLFNGRSDFQPFLDVGIPAGGVITGEDEIKSVESEKLFGGVAGMVLDPCYHQDCDRLQNLMGSGFHVMEQNVGLLGYLLDFFASASDISNWLESP